MLLRWFWNRDTYEEQISAEPWQTTLDEILQDIPQSTPVQIHTEKRTQAVQSSGRGRLAY